MQRMKVMYSGPDAMKAIQDTNMTARLSTWEKGEYLVYVPKDGYVLMDVKLSKDAASMPEQMGWIGKVADGSFGPYTPTMEEIISEEWILEKI